jgi:hypothetical protein
MDPSSAARGLGGRLRRTGRLRLLSPTDQPENVPGQAGDPLVFERLNFARVARARAPTWVRATAEPSRDKGMNSIRLKVTIDLNGNQALSVHELDALKPFVARGIAASLPDQIAVDTITVTSIKEKSSDSRSRSHFF